MAPTPDLVAEVRRRWEESQGHHAKFVKRYEKGERAYRGVLDRATSANNWRHTLHPPYAFNLLETIVSSEVEMGLALEVRPSPKVGLDYQAAATLLDQVEGVNYLLRHEHRVDEMDLKQRPLYLTAAIGGRGVLKEGWAYSKGAVRKQGVKMVDVHNDAGDVLGQVPTVTEIVEEGITRDHSTCEVVDPRDFVLNESARALQPWEPGGAQFVFHRMWMSYEQLRDLERSGYFQNVEQLKEHRDFAEEYSDRERELFNSAKTKNMVEVLEYWCYRDGLTWRAYVGNRSVILREQEPSPFWHGGYPFVICSSMPQPFSTVGTSDIELIADLQESLWELGNQTLDNIELVNNFITLIQGDVDDPDAFELYPGARWEVNSLNQVAQWQPPYQLANVTAAREALIKGDLQNVTSAAPLAAGADSNIDQKTATGVSLVMNAAQERMMAKKFQAQQALRQEAQLRLKNCQQFISDDKLVHSIGPSGVPLFRQLTPLDIQGDFVVELTAVNESQMRQERRAEAGTVVTMMQQMYPMSYASGTPIDMKAVLKWWSRQWGLEDEASAFFMPQQKPDPAMTNLLFGNAPHIQIRGNMDDQASVDVAQSEGAVPGQPQPPQPVDGMLSSSGGQMNMGTTAGSAVDASKPSATGGMSMSPAVMLQRARAVRGAFK